MNAGGGGGQALTIDGVFVMTRRDADGRGGEGAVERRVAAGLRSRFLAAIHFTAGRNSSMVTPARPSSALSVPRATYSWSGTDRVAVCPGLVRIMWLPRRRATFQPKRSKARTTSEGFNSGRGGIELIQTGTSSCRTSMVRGRPCSRRTARHSRIASRMFCSASSRVLP